MTGKSAAALVPELLARAPALTIVVTSRAALRVRGEQVLSIPPLEVPDPGTRLGLEHVSQVEAVALFAHRAAAAAPHFALTDQNAPQVAELVARLDGLPLAIELAASRAGVLPPGAMLKRMDQRLPLLLAGPRDLPARQQTLRATIGWSYELLDKDTRMLLRRFAVLAGGSTVETAEAVCGADTDLGIDVLEGLTVLAESSLVQTSSGSEADLRFGMLQTIREFGRERLEAEDDRATIERRHRVRGRT